MVIKLRQNQEVIFPEETVSLIRKFVEKYNLRELEEEKMKELREAKTFLEKKEIFESLPGRKIARAVKEVAEGKILPEDLPAHLQQILKIASIDAQKLARELQGSILILAKTVTIEETETPLSGVIKPPPPMAEEIEEKIIETKPEIPATPPREKPIHEKPDVYREPIE